MNSTEIELQDIGKSSHKLISSHTCSVAHIAQVSSKILCLVGLLPEDRGAVDIVRVDIVVVRVHPGQERASGRTAHGRRHKRVDAACPVITQNS